MSFEIAERILTTHRGAKFLKADLHVHTPASKDWDEHNTPEFASSNIAPEQIVKAALDADLDIIAITDHNSVEWCERIIQAAKGTKLTVLPGFELTARPGVHLLAIFPPEKPIEELNRLLIKVGIKNFGVASEMTDEAVENNSSDYKVIRDLREGGGLVIPAHIDLDSGIVGRLKGGDAVKEFFKKTSCTILEVKKQIPDVISTELRTDPTKYAIISGSDAHQLSDIGSKAIWIKMDMPNLSGISQLGFEPSSRLSKTAITTNGKFKILGMYSNGGLLGEQIFAFNEDLNCVIGGRGTGKSTIVDYLRFVFGGEPLDDELQRKFRKRLVDLIREATTVYVLTETAEGELWLYERTLSYDSVRRGNVTDFEITSSPATVYQVIAHQRRIVKFEEEVPTFRVEFYGQGEVQSITDTAEPARQLRLVDNFAQSSVKQRQRRAGEIEATLKVIETEIIERKDELEEVSIEINALDELKQRTTEIEGDLQDKHIKDHQVWEDANNWAVKSINHLRIQIERLDDLSFETLEEKTFSIQEAKGQDSLNALLSEIYSSIQALKEIEKSKGQFSNLSAKLKTLQEQWGTTYEDELVRYTSILRKQGVENLASLNRELSEKRSQIERIEKQLLPRKAELTKVIENSIKERQKLLKELRACWSEIRDCRIQAADHMTKKLGKDVVVKIADERDLEAYLTMLGEVAPSGIHSRDKQLQKIVEYSSKPEDIVGLIRNRDINSLCNIGITENTASILLQIPENDLMKLERVYLSDIANIKLKLEGAEKMLPDLSDGEKCTAILSVILLDETCPLVIDQPEDELDHAFIMSNVVNTLTRVKQKNDTLDKNFTPQKGRQFIIATHNQNIPVLGDAEMIFKMKKLSGQKRCEYENAHGLEHSDTIKHILSLEGGSDAFERRRRKYSANH